MDIPIGADLSALYAGLAQAVAAIQDAGAKFGAAFTQANAAIAAASAKMAQQAAQTSAVGTQATTAGAKLANMASIAGNVGSALSGAAAGAQLLARSYRVLSGVNLGTSIAGWITRVGGLRAAFAKIPAAMTAIANNPTLKKIVIGAAAAVAAVIAIRTAWRVAAAGARALSSAASATFRAVVSGAQKAAHAVRGAFSAAISAPGKLMAIPGLPIAGIIGGIGGIAGALGVAMSSITQAAEMESLETAFAPLLNGSEAAAARIKELAAFAAATPFELPEIAQASRVLEVLTKGALATGDGLRMVGDVAAATQQPFEEISMWVGRLYDGLQSNRPVGEAMARLQELGVVSGVVRGRIEALQKSGAAGPDIWNEAATALNRFAGSMARQSSTWNGKLSTLRDSIKSVMVAFGTPLIDALKPVLDVAIARMDLLKIKAAEFGESIKSAVNYLRAGFSTGQLIPLVATSLEAAMISAVNKLHAGFVGSVAFLNSSLGGIMKGIVNGLKDSGLLGAVQNLFTGIARKFTAIILEGLSNIRGLGGLKTNAREFDLLGSHELWLSKMEFETISFSAGIETMSREMAAAIKAGKEAFSAATAEPLLDPSKTRAKLKSIKEELKAAKESFDSESAREKARFDASLQKQTPKESVFPVASLAALAKGLAPAVTSLGRVGGGGSGGFSPMLSEQRRGNSILSRIERNTSRLSAAPVTIPVIA